MIQNITEISTKLDISEEGISGSSKILISKISDCFSPKLNITKNLKHLLQSIRNF